MSRTAIHPGERLAEELTEIGLSATELARQIKVPVNRITGIINGQRGITADTALRLGHWFGTSPQFWMNLQQLYELRRAEHAVGKKLARLPQRDSLPGSLAPTKTVSRRGRALCPQTPVGEALTGAGPALRARTMRDATLWLPAT